MTIEQILWFLPAAFLVGASPGANNLLAFASGANAGWRSAAKAVAGRLVAWAVLVILVAFGLDAVLHSSELAFVTLKWAGVCYLALLAWKFWRAEPAVAWDPQFDKRTAFDPDAEPSRGRAVLQSAQDALNGFQAGIVA